MAGYQGMIPPPGPPPGSMRARGMSARPLDVAVKATHMAIEMEPDGQERQALGQALSILLKIQNMHVSRNQQALQQRARP